MPRGLWHQGDQRSRNLSILRSPPCVLLLVLINWKIQLSVLIYTCNVVALLPQLSWMGFASFRMSRLAAGVQEWCVTQSRGFGLLLEKFEESRDVAAL